MRRIIYILLAFAITTPAIAQPEWYSKYIQQSQDFSKESITAHDSLYYGFGLNALTSTGKYAPFWISNNSWGRISTDPHSGNLYATIYKPAVRDNRWFDYSFGANAEGRLSATQSKVFINELFAHARVLAFDITVGIRQQEWGVQDKDLSSGGFLFSKNARSFPRITFGIDEYRPFPFTKGYLEFKAGITHGWMLDKVYVENYFVHHKFMGVRIGGNFPLNLIYEFHHAAQWGGTHPIYGELGSSFSDFWRVLQAKSGGVMANDQINSLGNHLGSQNIAFELKFKDWKMRGYWQGIFEDGPFGIPWNNQNRPDVLTGISLEQRSWPYISKILYEFFQSTDQAGPFHDKDGVVYGGADGYYNNSIYLEGWTHYNRVIGTPLITSPIYNSNGAIRILNNRVVAHHIGIMGDIYGFKYRTLFTHSRNYGTYGADESKYTINNAILIDVRKNIPQAWGLDFGIKLGLDYGTQFGNSFGAMFTVSKVGLIKSWRR